jgi:hypothetical protein
MSRYFDALMRSAGLTGGEPLVAMAQAAPDIVETEAAQEILGQAVQPEPVSRTLQRPEPPSAIEAVTTTTQAQPAPRPNGQRLEPPASDLGHTLIRAAMKWVAADTPPRREQTLETPATASLFERTVTEPESSGNSPAAEQVRFTEQRESVVVPSRTIGEARPPEFVSFPATSGDTHDERVEVTIGTINVRVDAPAPHTVAEPSATPRPTRAAAAARPPSALSRRALRRI